MIKLQQNRYLWVHFAGLAFVPLLLDICLAGLASAGPALAFKGQFWAIALLSITPAVAMQWFKPFYVFSLPPVALKPAVLSEDQRRCLQIFKSWQIKALAIAVAVFSLWLLAQLYAMSPQVSPLLTAKSGLVSAAIAFFLASTFMQIAMSAGRALLISPTALKRVAAVDESAIATDFLIVGFSVNKLFVDALPQVDLDLKQSGQPTSKPVPTEAEQTPEPVAVPEPVTVPEPAIVSEPVTAKEPVTVEDPVTVEAPEEEGPPQTPELIEAVSESDVEKSEEIEIVIPEMLPPKESGD